MTTSKTEDGGPAFPIPCSDLVGAYEPAAGMSLRDWFAGQALVGLCTDTKDFRATANLAYAIADAMLSARSGGGQS